MKTLYLECSTGVAGDMTISALAGLLDDPDSVAVMINNLGIPGITARMERSEKNGIAGRRLSVEIHGSEEDDPHHEHMHHHSSPANVRQIINFLDVSDFVKKNANEIYDLIAEAEAAAHGIPVEQVHFHEVGMLDAVADIVGTCMLIEFIAPEQIVSSPIRTGYGHVRCAHGVLPIPAPATEYLLRGIPAFAGDTEGEFCTPTGAAIVKHFADRFENMPHMVFERTGYGMGKKNFGIANFMRAYLGETDEELPKISELSCNVDDMTAEDLAAAAETILNDGALDVFITPVIMKKGRPGSMLTCLCRASDSGKFAKLMLERTSTTGVRRCASERYEMSSEIGSKMTCYGQVRVKKSKGFGVEKEKIEHDDIVRLSGETGLPISAVKKNLRSQ